MKKLTKTEINFIKETGWTPAVEQCDEWERTIFVNLFNKATFKKKHLDEQANHTYRLLQKEYRDRIKVLEEIEAHGKPINHSHVFRDRTKYNRKDKHKNNRYE